MAATGADEEGEEEDGLVAGEGSAGSGGGSSIGGKPCARCNGPEDEEVAGEGFGGECPDRGGVEGKERRGEEARRGK